MPMPPAYNPTVGWITLRALLGRKRSLILFAPGVVLLLLAVIVSAENDDSTSAQVLSQLAFSAALPLIALIVSTSVLGTEMEDNSLLHLLATPVSRTTIVLTKAIVATGVTFVFTAVPAALGAFVDANSGGRLALALTAGSAVGALAYCAIFVLLCTVAKHPIIYGLAYIAIWESLIGNLVGGAKFLSVRQYALGVAGAVGRNAAVINSHLGATTALILAAVVILAALSYASSRLRSYALTGEV